MARNSCLSPTAGCRWGLETCCEFPPSGPGWNGRRQYSPSRAYIGLAPTCSIDGKRFVYSLTRGGADQFNNLYVQPTAGGEPYKLTFFEHDAFHPRWSPDGEWIAYISNADGLPQLALLETYGGERRKVRIAQRQWKRAMGTLSVRTVDRRTNAAIPSRIHLTASDGKFYAPADAYARVTGMGDPAFYHGGEFQIEVPVGKVRLTAVKGFEYRPEKAEVEVWAGAASRVTLSLARMSNLAAKGWHGGSTHVHPNYGGNLHNTLENVMRMSEAEDQDVVAVMAANKDNRVLDYQFLSRAEVTIRSQSPIAFSWWAKSIARRFGATFPCSA